MSPAEEQYLRDLLTLNRRTDKQRLLYEVAGDLYGKKYHELEAKPCVDSGNGEAILVKKAVGHFQKKIQHMQTSIAQLAFNMGKFTDGSKQRQRLRSKLSAEKSKVDNMVRKYNILATNKCAPEQLESGNFPWKPDLQSTDAVPNNTKRALVDKNMEALRFKEEVDVLQREMKGFMRVYTYSLLPSLGREKSRLQELLKETGESSRFPVPAESSSHRYSTSSTDRHVVLAKLALVMDGADFALKQIATGISAFASVLTDELDPFREVLLVNHLDDERSDDHEDSDADDDDNDVDEIRLTEDLDADDAEFAGNESEMVSEQRDEADVLLRALNKLPTPSVPMVVPEAMTPGVTCWQFPASISQSRYNGRNGSNACSVISVMLCYTLWLRKTPSPESKGSLPDAVVDALCGCIELGNRVYDLCRETLPSRYLSVEEAANLLDMWCNTAVESTLPVRLDDQHHPSTIVGQLQQAITTRHSYIACLILNEKTSLFYATEGKIMYIDTHCHGSGGSVIVTSPVQLLGAFCETVWHIEGNDRSTYGNLAFVSFQT